MQKPPVYTNPISITNQFPFCGLPLRMDSYAGCAFQCTYCFARYRAGYSYEDNIRPADPVKISRLFQNALEGGAKNFGVISQFIRRRVPVHFGGMSDPFQPAETRFRVTEAILRTMVRHHYPTVISTKGSLVCEDRYVRLLREIGPVVVQFSFSTLRDDISKRVEPFSIRPSLLLRTMETLSKAGIHVTCRWQPYIPGTSEPPSDFVPRVASTGCRHLALEHLKVPMERNHALWGALVAGAGNDLHQVYVGRGARLTGREYVLPVQEKFSTVLETRGYVRKHRMTFGAADNEFQYLSDTECCCSGVDQFPGFENWFKHQIGYAVRKCKGKQIAYTAISGQWVPNGSVNRYLNSHCRLPDGTLRNHVMAKWDAASGSESPASFFGVVAAQHKRTAGHRVYNWDRNLFAMVAACEGAALESQNPGTADVA
jgi:DNA repair photolyase